jgi:hypothetical protein
MAGNTNPTTCSGGGRGVTDPEHPFRQATYIVTMKRPRLCYDCVPAPKAEINRKFEYREMKVYDRRIRNFGQVSRISSKEGETLWPCSALQTGRVPLSSVTDIAIRVALRGRQGGRSKRQDGVETCRLFVAASNIPATAVSVSAVWSALLAEPPVPSTIKP